MTHARWTSRQECLPFLQDAQSVSKVMFQGYLDNPTFFVGSLETRVYVKVGLIATIIVATFGAIHCAA